MNMMFKRIISCIIVICLTVSMLAWLTKVTESKGSLEKYLHFFEQDADFDVLFMGSSKVINGILPMELWNDYGIVSYNMGGHSNTIPTSYWVLRNALDHTTPKCVVFDCAKVNVNRLVSSSFEYTHLSFDAFPLSFTKAQAVLDLVKPQEWENYQAKRMELLWNFSIYHHRWNALGAYDFSPSYTNYHKGAEPRVNVSFPANMASVSPDARSSTDTLGMQYLIKAIELCQSRGIEILLINIPYPTDEETLVAANTVADVAKTYGVEYLNFFNIDTVDYQTDMSDPSSHLNPSGAYKITDYLGQVLSERYNAPDRRSHPDYQSWHYDAEMYQQAKIQQFDETNCAWDYWMLLSDNDFSFIAEVSESDLRRDAVLTALLRNAGIQPEKVQGRCIIAADRNSGTITYTAYDTLLQGSAETALGTLSLDGNSVKLDAQECWQITEPAVMYFALINSEKELVGSTYFSAENIQSQHAG